MHGIMSQYADGGCAWPPPFLPMYPLHSSYVAPFSPPARLTINSYLYYRHIAPLLFSVVELRRPLCCAEQLACEREELTSLEYDGPCIDETYRKQSHYNQWWRPASCMYQLFMHQWFIRHRAQCFWWGKHPLRGQVGGGWTLEIETFFGPCEMGSSR